MSEDRVSPKFWATVTILVAAIGCAGSIIAGVIGILPDISKPEDSAATPPTEVVAVPTSMVEQRDSSPETIQPQPTVEREENNGPWISCDENMTVLERSFYWSGPAGSSCVVKLGEGEFIVGTADRYGDKANDPPESTRCVAFALIGPLDTVVVINHGGGGNLHPATTVYQENVHLLPKQRELDEHDSCNMNARGYDTIVCTQDGCVSK